MAKLKDYKITAESFKELSELINSNDLKVFWTYTITKKTTASREIICLFQSIHSMEEIEKILTGWEVTKEEFPF
jgi:hypothetical protein